MTPAARSPHIPALDGLRGIAVLLVMFFHYAVAIGSHTPFWDGLRTAMGFGWSGVDLFFVLSGFLITGILLDTRDSENFFSSFWSRRILRIFPAYYCLLAIFVLWKTWGGPDIDEVLPSRKDWLLYFAYLQNWRMLLHTKPAQAVHLWSLGVEEQFYLLWPLAVFFVPLRRLGKLAAGLAVAALVLRLVLLPMVKEEEGIYRNTFTRMDGLLLGAIVAIVFRNPRAADWIRSKTTALMGAGAATMLIVPLYAHSLSNHNPRILGIGLTVIGISYALILAAVAGSRAESIWNRLLRWFPLRQLGKLSYGVYLYHILAFRLLTEAEASLHWGELGGWNIPLGIAVSISCALASYYLLERHFLRLKDHFQARAHSPSLAVTGNA